LNADYHALSDEYTDINPTYRSNSTNSTSGAVLFSLEWGDNEGLDSYIFSFDNCTGTLTNDSAVSFNDGTVAWSNVSKVVNSTVDCTIEWKIHANDTSNNWNVSESYNLTITDVVSPTFSNNQTNTTTAGAPANFTIDVIDENDLDTTAGYIFSTNNSGTWVNSSFVYFTGLGTTLTAWNVTVLNSAVGVLIQWKFYANDTFDNWNVSDISSFITVPTHCDVGIQSIPQPEGYQANLNNTYYCLAKDFYNVNLGSWTGAIEFDGNVENSTLDCLGYDLDGIDAISVGVYVGVTTPRINANITIKNCNISDFIVGIRVWGSSNTTVINSTLISNKDGFNIEGTHFNITNNTIESNSERGIEDISPGISYSYIEDNYFINNNIGIELSPTGSQRNITINNNEITNSTVDGIYLVAIDMKYVSITNNDITGAYKDSGKYDIRIRILDNSIIENNTVGSIFSQYFTSSAADYITIKNNTVKDGHGIEIEEADYNVLIDNTIYNCTYGIYFDDIGTLKYSQYNSITGGSIYNNTIDYRLDLVGTTNNFTNTNFTGSRTIWFEATGDDWFNYRNDSTNNIWLKTNVSAASNITRELINWNQTVMKWNDTNSSGSEITVRYSITGLLASTDYEIYNNSVLVKTDTTDSSGALSQFNINLMNEHEIKIQQSDSNISSGEIDCSKNAIRKNQLLNIGTNLILKGTGTFTVDNFDLTMLKFYFDKNCKLIWKDSRWEIDG